MINFEALYTISYGLYIVCSGDKSKGNGFISNTVFQVTAEPPRFAACCNKDNYTAQFIQNKGAFSVSVMQKDASPDIVERFGYKSGRDLNKLEGMQVLFGETGVPVLLDDAIAFLECRVVQTIDVGTHYLFIGELVQSEILNDSLEPLTYLYYRQTRKGVAPKNAPTYIDPSKLERKAGDSVFRKFKCKDCGYIYDEEKEGKKFTDLPDDWVCPICGAPKKDFVEM